MINILIQYVCMSILILSMINPIGTGSEIENVEMMIGIDNVSDKDLLVSSDHFIMNVGQIEDSEILFYSSSGNAYFSSDRILFRIRDLEPIASVGSGDPGDPRYDITEYRERGVVLGYGFGGSNPSIPSGRERCSFDTNYFKGSDPEGWHTGVPNYQEIIYPDLWDGIDLVFRIAGGKIKYDLIVEPGADPRDIVFTIEGHESLSIDKSGDLVIGTGYMDIRDSGLISFQEGSVISDCSFDIRNENSYGFTIPDYDDTKELIIDPILDYSTFIGGSGYEIGIGIYVDEDGCAYVTGMTNDDITNYPTTTGAYDISHNGDTDVLVTKLSSDGSSLIYSTFIGGSDSDRGLDIFVDDNGTVYVAGFTNNATENYPTTDDAFSTEQGGGLCDAFVTKLSPNGSALVYSTFIGGSEIDMVVGIDVNDNGNAFVVGYTMDGETDYPTTSGAHNETNSGLNDVFVTKLSSDGSSLVYSTLLGGSDSDYGIAICIDDVGHAYTTGRTVESSSNFPVTPDAYNTSHSGNTDVFVTKLSTDGSSLVYSTYLGGSGFEGGRGIDIDSSGCAYVSGHTKSTGFPTTSGSFDESYNGWDDVFVTKLSSDGTSLKYSTFLGGEEDDWGYGIDVDDSGKAHITGYTEDGAVDYPVTSGGLYTTHNGKIDGFLTILGSTGSNLEYSTYLGGDEFDAGADIILSNDYRCFIAGFSNDGTVDYPTTSGVYDTTHNGADDLIITTFIMEMPGPDIGVDSTDKICTTGDEFEFAIDVSDPSGISEVKVEYWFGSGTHQNDSMTGSGTYYRTITIPSDSLDDLSYIFHAASVAGMWSQTSRKGRVVIDNDDPTLGEDHSDTEGTTGDGFTFSISADDNIDVHRVYVDFWIGSGSHQNFSMVGPDPHHITVQIPMGSVSDLHYMFHASDEAGNWAGTSPSDASISDNDPPIFQSDLSDQKATTGDSFTFMVSVDDNIEISSVSVEYWFGSGKHTNMDMEGSGPHNLTITIPSDSIESLQFVFHAEDDSGNDAVTDHYEVEVADNDPPWFISDASPDEAGSGDTIEIKVQVGDNIGISRVDLIWKQDMDGDNVEERMSLSDGWYVSSLTFPMDWEGAYFYHVRITDTSGSTNVSEESIFHLLDDIPPSVEPIEDISVPVGYNVTVVINATDNIGIDYYQWSGSPIPFFNNMISGIVQSSGIYTITVEVIDFNNNRRSLTFNITVFPLDHDADYDGIPDHVELEWGLDYQNPDDAELDPDNDTLTNLEEYQEGTDHDDPDTDGDGMDDGWEVDFETDPLNESSMEDPDNDGLHNLGEYLNGTDPQESDTDLDGMPDGWEVQYGLDPLVYSAKDDGDGDGINDLDEYLGGTDPTVSDKVDDVNDGTDYTPIIIGVVIGIIILLVIIIIAVVLILRKKDEKIDSSALDDLASGKTEGESENGGHRSITRSNDEYKEK